MRIRCALAGAAPCAACAILLAAAAPAPRPASAAGDWPVDCIVPPAIPMAPDGSFPCRIVINSTGGPVVGSYVEIEFSGEAAALIAWTVPVPAGADTAVGVGQYGGPVFAGHTDINGEIIFHIAGAGCVAEKVGEVNPYIAQVRADNFLLAEPAVNSPDAVDADGTLPEALGTSICDPATGTTSVGLADALFHTPAVKQGLVEICTDFTNDDDPNVNLADAGLLTPYVRGGTGGSCVYSGP